MKKVLESILAWQLRRLLKKNKQLLTIAVAGSVGKTSTKIAIATVLGKEKRVVYQEGNYNVALTIPLIYFRQTVPAMLENVFAWLIIFVKNEFTIRQKYPYDVAVIEMGIDRPNEMAQLCTLLTPDIAVITAVAFEHMANFTSLDQVAEEELLLSKHSKLTFVCAESIDRDYYKDYEVQTYGVHRGLVTVAPIHDKQIQYPQLVTVHLSSGESFDAEVQLLGEHSLTSAAAAVAVAERIGISTQSIKNGLQSLRSFTGRMNVLKGIHSSTIIDDTYNASPEAVQKALVTLYEMKSPQKIAVLGSMNELGGFSESAHKEIGHFCTPKQLDYVITIGEEAKRFLAPAALQNGCKVVSFMSPYEAGDYVKTIVKKDATLLFKGSQNGVFAEEAVKSVLDNPEDKKLLVRQSTFWLKKKSTQFSALEQAQ